MPAIDQHPHSEDARLVARAQAGDQSAFRQLFEAYSPIVYRIAFRMLGHAEDAADLTQDAFVRAFERLHALKDGQAFHAWITRLAANMAHDRLRRKRPHSLSLDAPPPGAEEGMVWEIADESGDRHETRMLGEELARHVQEALLAISPEHRIVVVLHHMEGMPVDEIAGTLGVPVGTVKSRLARARADLRRRLEGYIVLPDL